MYIKNIQNHMIALGISLFLPDFPLIEPISTSRLGFAIIIISFILKTFNNLNSKPISFSPKPVISSLSIAVLAVFISSLYHMVEIGRITNWILTFIAVLAITPFLIDKENGYKIIKYTSIYSFILLLVLVIYSVNNYGILAFKNKIMRFSINELPPGLNRIVNGIIFANIYILMLNTLRKTKFNQIIAIFSFVLSYWFILSTYTRQGFVLITLLLIGIILFYLKDSKNKFKPNVIIIIVIIITIFSSLILQSEIFIENFVNRTEQQLDNDEGSTAYRIYLYKKGIEFIENNIIFGIGPNNFLNYTGRDAHSGYIHVISENGILATLSIIILVYYSITYSLKSIFNRNFNNVFPIIILTILIAPFFKTIYHLPMFWATLLLVFKYHSYTYTKVISKR